MINVAIFSTNVGFFQLYMYMFMYLYYLLLKKEAKGFLKKIVVSCRLSISKKISEDPVCIKICQRVDSKNYLELFNVSWLSIRECEIRNPDFTVQDHRAYFKTVARRTHARGALKDYQAHRDDSVDHGDATNSRFWYCPADLIAWCEKKTEDEEDMFYRELLTLHHRCRFNRDAIELTGMKPDDFYKYLKEAKRRFKNDLIASRNIDDAHRDGVV